MLHIAFCIKHSKSVNVTGLKNVKLAGLYIKWTTTTTKIFARKAAGNLTTNYLRTLAGSDNLRLFTMIFKRNVKRIAEMEKQLRKQKAKGEYKPFPYPEGKHENEKHAATIQHLNR